MPPRKRAGSVSVDKVVVAMTPKAMPNQDPIQALVMKQAAELERLQAKVARYESGEQEDLPPRGKAASEFSTLLHESLENQTEKSSPSVIDMLRRRESIPILKPATTVSIPRVAPRTPAGKAPDTTILDSAFARNFTKFFD